MSAGNGPRGDRPPLRLRQIFVQYVYTRRCRRNPSMDRFEELDAGLRSALLRRARERREAGGIALPLRIR